MPCCEKTERGPAVSAVLLAAGKGERFQGENKLLCDLGGKSVLERSAGALSPGLRETVAVVRDAETERECGRLGLRAVRYAGGTISDSIRVGLSALGACGGVLFLNADRPFVRQESVERMLELFREDPERVVRLAYGGVPANPVLFPAAAIPALRALRGDRGGSALLRGGAFRVCCAEASSERELLDVDTREALLRARKYLLEGTEHV